MAAKLTQQEYIEQATKVHNGKYTYERMNYISGKHKIEITCPIHGSFWQLAESHKNDKRGCNACGRVNTEKARKLDTQIFIERAIAIHGDLYDYSLVEYVLSKSPIDIICRKHGKFTCIPNTHLMGHGCPKCAQEATGARLKSNTEDFIRKARLTHGDKYTYNFVEYVDSKTKVIITCPIHENFKQPPDNHIAGAGCPHCGKSGYNRLKPGTLYVLNHGNVTKVGITNRTAAKRAKEVKNTGAPDFNVHSSFYFEDGEKALNLETAIHRHLEKQYSRVDEVYQGSTECFYDVDLEALTSFIIPLASANNLAANVETNNCPHNI